MISLPKGFTLKPSAVRNIVKAAASYLISHIIKQPVVWGRPVGLMIEPINRCNLQCPLCPIGTGELTREPGAMSLANFIRILDNAGPQIRTLALWNQGEPTINDELPEMIRIAKQRRIYTVTSTNGTLILRRNLARRLIEAGLDELIFSIDGLTQKTYEIYRVGGRLETVVEGMKEVRRLRDELGKTTPRIVMQWLPMKHNTHEIPRLRKTAAGWGADTVEIKTTQIYTDEQAEAFLPEVESLRRYERRGQKWETKRRYQSCRRLWFSTVVDWDGTVIPCCFDKDEDYPMGNALTEDLATIWKGKAYSRLRRVLLKEGRREEMCRNCTEGLKSYYIPIAQLETDLSTDKGISRLDESPGEIGGMADADAGCPQDSSGPSREKPDVLSNR